MLAFLFLLSIETHYTSPKEAIQDVWTRSWGSLLVYVHTAITTLLKVFFIDVPTSLWKTLTLISRFTANSVKMMTYFIYKGLSRLITYILGLIVNVTSKIFQKRNSVKFTTIESQSGLSSNQELNIEDEAKSGSETPIQKIEISEEKELKYEQSAKEEPASEL